MLTVAVGRKEIRLGDYCDSNWGNTPITKSSAEVLGEMDHELEALHKQANKMRMVGEAMKQGLLTGKVRLA